MGVDRLIRAASLTPGDPGAMAAAAGHGEQKGSPSPCLPSAATGKAGTLPTSTSRGFEAPNPPGSAAAGGWNSLPATWPPAADVGELHPPTHTALPATWATTTAPGSCMTDGGLQGERTLLSINFPPNEEGGISRIVHANGGKANGLNNDSLKGFSLPARSPPAHKAPST